MPRLNAPPNSWRVPLQEMMSCPVEATLVTASGPLGSLVQRQQSDHIFGTPKVVNPAELMSDLVFSPTKQKKPADHHNQRLLRSEPCQYFQLPRSASISQSTSIPIPSTPSHAYIKTEPLSESSYAYPQPPPSVVASSYQQLNSGLLLGGRRKATRQDDILAQVFAQSDELDELLNSPQPPTNSTPCLLRSTNTGVQYYLTDESLFSQQQQEATRVWHILIDN